MSVSTEPIIVSDPIPGEVLPEEETLPAPASTAGQETTTDDEGFSAPVQRRSTLRKAAKAARSRGPRKVLETSKTTPVSQANWCMFEDHVFDSHTKAWKPIRPDEAMRRCTHSKCTRKHKLSNRASQVCPRETDCPEAGVSCFLLHDNTRILPLCYYGKICADKECTAYRHPRERTTEECPLDGQCEQALISCFKLHSMSKLTPVCRYKKDCVNYICSKRHGPGRKEICDSGSMCYNHILSKYYPDDPALPKCDRLHPKILQKICRWDNSEFGCRSFGCPYVHHPEAPIDCPEGMQCSKRISKGNDRCPHKHPKFSRVETLPDGSLYFE